MIFGILNATPDSFYAGSRVQGDEAITERAREIARQGGSVIDVGACSTRPGAERATEDEERRRLRHALPLIAAAATGLPISIDTYRPDIARMAVEEYGATYINDVSASDEMFQMAARLRTPYILMSSQSDIETMAKTFARQTARLYELGLPDIILDPGFGFGKTVEQNYDILRQLDFLRVFHLPIMAALSRKSMIYKPLGLTPDDALTGTIALNTIALQKGATILRVHDVAAAAQTEQCVEMASGRHQTTGANF